MKIKSDETKFLAHPDKDEVSAIRMAPRGSKFMIVLGHGAGAGMRHANITQIAEGLYHRKIATFRYQFPYMERGGGRDSQTVSLATVASAVREAKRSAPRKTIIAAGHSFGGRMTSLAAAEGLLPQAKGLIYFAFPLHAVGKPSSHRADHLPAIKQPMLFLSGSRDQMMSPDLFKPVLNTLGRRAKFHSIETANHGYKILKKTRKSEEDVFDEMTRVCSEWLEKLKH